MNSVVFRRAIIASLVGHMAMFGAFSFSFGPRLPIAQHSQGFFLGAILEQGELAIRNAALFSPTRKVVKPASEIPMADVQLARESSTLSVYQKPFVAPGGSELEKITFLPKTAPLVLLPQKPTPPIMLYPELPYNFLLYFKDRQVAHIKLSFKVNAQGRASAAEIKRQTSSGNLEADLLAMRYMSHYLFVQQTGFPLNEWQTVTIDLSAKEN